MGATTFKRIGLIGRDRDGDIRAMLADLSDWLGARGCEVPPALNDLSVRDEPSRLERAYADEAPDLVIVVGGDGTLLNAARLLARHGIPLLGVNVGRLGFLADIPLGRMREGVADVLAGRFTEERRALLAGAVHRQNGACPARLALNDVVMQKSESGRMIEFETHVDGSFVCTHRADGIIVATPTGSTAYALSGGGPILHPALDATALVPICPHTLSDRPIVVSSASKIEIVLTRGHGSPVGQASWDGQDWEPLALGDRVALERAEDAVRLLHPLDHDYYKTLRTKLHWGHGRESA
jgi:NAD+ kinase